MCVSQGNVRTTATNAHAPHLCEIAASVALKRILRERAQVANLACHLLLLLQQQPALLEHLLAIACLLLQLALPRSQLRLQIMHIKSITAQVCICECV